jgi:hypothetical protein
MEINCTQTEVGISCELPFVNEYNDGNGSIVVVGSTADGLFISFIFTVFLIFWTLERLFFYLFPKTVKIEKNRKL